MNPEVDAYVRRADKWPAEMADLRPILLSGGLTEEIKWGKPCYSYEGKNIVILHEMKAFLRVSLSTPPAEEGSGLPLVGLRAVHELLDVDILLGERNRDAMGGELVVDL